MREPLDGSGLGACFFVRALWLLVRTEAVFFFAMTNPNMLPHKLPRCPSIKRCFAVFPDSSGERDKGCREGTILLEKDRAQVEQHAAFFNPGDDRRIRLAKAGAQFVGAEIAVGERDEACWESCRGSSAAPNDRFAVEEFEHQLSMVHLTFTFTKA